MTIPSLLFFSISFLFISNRSSLRTPRFAWAFSSNPKSHSRHNSTQLMEHIPRRPKLNLELILNVWIVTCFNRVLGEWNRCTQSRSEKLGDFVFARNSQNPPRTVHFLFPATFSECTLPDEIFNDSQNQPSQRVLYQTRTCFHPTDHLLKASHLQRDHRVRNLSKMRMTFLNLFYLEKQGQG